MPLHFFGFTSTIRRFGERFRDDQYSLANFLFFCFSTLGAPPVPSHLYKWEHVPPCLMCRRHFRGTVSHQKTSLNSHSISMHENYFPVFAFKVAESDTVNSVL